MSVNASKPGASFHSAGLKISDTWLVINPA
jgi:hypothetical protein